MPNNTPNNNLNESLALFRQYGYQPGQSILDIMVKHIGERQREILLQWGREPHTVEHKEIENIKVFPQQNIFTWTADESKSNTEPSAQYNNNPNPSETSTSTPIEYEYQINQLFIQLLLNKNTRHSSNEIETLIKKFNQNHLFQKIDTPDRLKEAINDLKNTLNQDHSMDQDHSRDQRYKQLDQAMKVMYAFKNLHQTQYYGLVENRTCSTYWQRCCKALANYQTSNKEQALANYQTSNKEQALANYQTSNKEQRNYHQLIQQAKDKTKTNSSSNAEKSTNNAVIYYGGKENRIGEELFTAAFCQLKLQQPNNNDKALAQQARDWTYTQLQASATRQEDADIEKKPLVGSDNNTGREAQNEKDSPLQGTDDLKSTNQGEQEEKKLDGPSIGSPSPSNTSTQEKPSRWAMINHQPDFGHIFTRFWADFFDFIRVEMGQSHPWKMSLFTAAYWQFGFAAVLNYSHSALAQSILMPLFKFESHLLGISPQQLLHAINGINDTIMRVSHAEGTMEALILCGFGMAKVTYTIIDQLENILNDNPTFITDVEHKLSQKINTLSPTDQVNQSLHSARANITQLTAAVVLGLLAHTPISCPPVHYAQSFIKLLDNISPDIFTHFDWTTLVALKTAGIFIAKIMTMNSYLKEHATKNEQQEVNIILSRTKDDDVQSLVSQIQQSGEIRDQIKQWLIAHLRQELPIIEDSKFIKAQIWLTQYLSQSLKIFSGAVSCYAIALAVFLLCHVALAPLAPYILPPLLAFSMIATFFINKWQSKTAMHCLEPQHRANSFLDIINPPSTIKRLIIAMTVIGSIAGLISMALFCPVLWPVIGVAVIATALYFQPRMLAAFSVALVPQLLKISMLSVMMALSIVIVPSLIVYLKYNSSGRARQILSQYAAIGNIILHKILLPVGKTLLFYSLGVVSLPFVALFAACGNNNAQCLLMTLVNQYTETYLNTQKVIVKACQLMTAAIALVLAKLISLPLALFGVRRTWLNEQVDQLNRSVGQLFWGNAQAMNAKMAQTNSPPELLYNKQKAHCYGTALVMCCLAAAAIAYIALSGGAGAIHLMGMAIALKYFVPGCLLTAILAKKIVGAGCQSYSIWHSRSEPSVDQDTSVTATP